MIMSGTALRTPAISSLNMDRRLLPLPSSSRTCRCSTRGAGVVAVDRLLDLRLHRHRNVFREVGRNPFRTVGRSGDDELVLVLGEQGSVEEVHGVSLKVMRRKLYEGGVRRACRR